MEKYGLQFRVQSSHEQKQRRRTPLPPPPCRQWFRVLDDIGGGDDDNDVEREIFRQAIKNKTHAEEQHKKALEENPLVFQYDQVYDDMKRVTCLRDQNCQDRKPPKYILEMINKSKERVLEQEIIYERKLVKDRSKDEHLFTGKDTFVTAGYKRRLAERAEFECSSQLGEQKEDVTKKRDISVFYFNLGENVSFGGKRAKSTKPEKELPVHTFARERAKSTKPEKELPVHTFARETPVMDTCLPENSSTERPLAYADQSKSGHYEKNEDTLAAAKKRFFERKRAKEQ